MRASCGTVYCNQYCLWVCGCVCLFCGSVTMITGNCVHHQTGSVGKGSDHLQLVKFWPSCAPGKGVCGGAKKFWFHLTAASMQCLRFSERFFLFWILKRTTYPFTVPLSTGFDKQIFARLIISDPINSLFCRG